MTTGILVLGGYNEESTPILQQLFKQKVISNYKIPIEHTFIKFSSKPQMIWGKDEIHIPYEDVAMNLSDKSTRQVALLQEMLKRCDEIVVVFPNENEVNRLVLLLGIASGKPFHMILANRPIKDEKVRQVILSSDLELLRRQYEEIVGIKRPVREYNPSELIKTPNGATLRPYQQQMVDFVCEVKRAGLFVDMGLGKTLATLATINKLAEENKIDKTKPVLIVAPITVALDTWAREAEKWGYDMDIKINIKLSKAKRAELLDELLEPQKKLTLVTTNPAQLEAIHKYYQSKHQKEPFTMYIVDELSMFKSHAAKRFDILSKMSRDADYFIGLTGTPAPNNLLDIWSQMILIDINNFARFGQNFYIYRDKYFDPQATRSGKIYKWNLKQNAEYDIYNKMKPSVISMKSTGLVDLPDITYSNLYVHLPKKAMKTYKELDTKIRRKLQALENEGVRGGIDATTDKNSFRIANTAVLNGKLTQLSSGAIYDDFLDRFDKSSDADDVDVDESDYTEFHDVKFRALQEIVETATSPILVFFYFKSELERMKDYIDFEFLDSHSPNFRDTISRWNNGEIPVLVAHPASAGHGLNLQDGGHTIVWLTTTWSNEQYRQANKRLHRSGQKNTVNVIHIVAEGTVDEEIISRIDEKEENQDKLMRALDTAIRPTIKCE